MATRRQAEGSRRRIVIGAHRTAASILFGGGAQRSRSYSFGALTTAQHAELLAILKAALLSSGLEGAAAATEGGFAADDLKSPEKVKDALARQKREQALLAKVATTTASQILQKSKAAQAMGL